MPFLNFDSRHFSVAEKTAIQDCSHYIRSRFSFQVANLSAQERQQYGSVNEQNKLIINKVKDYRETQPNLSSPDVDWVEFMQDHDSRAFLQTKQNVIRTGKGYGKCQNIARLGQLSSCFVTYRLIHSIKTIQELLVIVPK